MTLTRVIMLHYFTSYHIRECFTKKNRCSFGFCPDEGGEGPAQIFCPLFTNCILGQFGDGDGEVPAHFFLHIGVKKKWYNLSKLGGGGESR